MPIIETHHNYSNANDAPLAAMPSTEPKDSWDRFSEVREFNSLLDPVGSSPSNFSSVGESCSGGPSAMATFSIQHDAESNLEDDDIDAMVSALIPSTNHANPSNSRDWGLSSEELDKTLGIGLDFSNLFDETSPMSDVMPCIPLPSGKLKLPKDFTTPSILSEKEPPKFSTPRTLAEEPPQEMFASEGKVAHNVNAKFDSESILEPEMISRAIADAVASLPILDAVTAPVQSVTQGQVPVQTTKIEDFSHIKDAASKPPEFFEVTDKDVLFGRGGKSNHHPGNKMYRDEVKNLQDWYKSCSKSEKTQISNLLVERIRSCGGHFLKQDSKSKKWYAVSASVARKKASQGLRELEEASTPILKHGINRPEEAVKKKFKKGG